MKPVNINLVVKKKIWAKISLALVAILAVTTCAVTLVNTYDYFANTKVIAAYEKRVKKVNQQTERKRNQAIKAALNSEENVQLKKEIDLFSDIINRSLFPLPRVLTEIEKAKPDRINIEALIFSEKLNTIKIKGESANVGAVSKFIMDLSRSKYFEVQLSKEEIKENRRIVFELTAKWADVKNG